jgi:superfamily II DNA or RNA helicase
MAKETKLRPYQQAAFDEFWQAVYSGHKGIVVPIPTGGGKSVVAREIIKSALKGSKGQCLFIAHRDELIKQAGCHLQRAGFVRSEIGYIKAGMNLNLSRPIQIASVQSAVNRDLGKLKPVLIVIDEAHRTNASTYQEIIKQFPHAVRLGLTATPARTDGTGLRDGGYDYMTSVVDMQHLIKEGYLSKYKLHSLPELDESELNNSLAENWLLYANGMRTIVFAKDIDHSHEIVAHYNACGIPAAHIDGSTSRQDRQYLIRMFIKKEILVLSQVGIIDEGFDLSTYASLNNLDPDADIGCVQIARKTKSLIKWLQACGRALRPHPEKEYAVILDHGGCYQYLGFPCDPHQWTLDGVTQRSRQQAQEQEQFEREKRPVRTRSGELIHLHPTDTVYVLGKWLEENELLDSPQAPCRNFIEANKELITIRDLARINQLYIQDPPAVIFKCWLKIAEHNQALDTLLKKYDLSTKGGAEAVIKELRAWIKVFNDNRPAHWKAMNWQQAYRVWNRWVDEGRIPRGVKVPSPGQSYFSRQRRQRF